MLRNWIAVVAAAALMAGCSASDELAVTAPTDDVDTVTLQQAMSSVRTFDVGLFEHSVSPCGAGYPAVRSDPCRRTCGRRLWRTSANTSCGTLTRGSPPMPCRAGGSGSRAVRAFG